MVRRIIEKNRPVFVPTLAVAGLLSLVGCWSGRSQPVNYSVSELGRNAKSSELFVQSARQNDKAEKSSVQKSRIRKNEFVQASLTVPSSEKVEQSSVYPDVHQNQTSDTKVQPVSFVEHEDSADSPSSHLNHFIQMGLNQNLEIQEASHLVLALSHRIEQAGSLSDPVLGATAYPSPIQTAAGQQEFALSLKQKFPGREKRALRAAVAREEYRAAELRLCELKLSVTQRIKDSYFELAYLDQAISITENDREQLSSIEKVVDQVFRVKKTITQQDVLQVQVNLSKVDAEIVRLKQRREATAAILNRLVGMPSKSKIELQNSWAPIEQVADLPELFRIATENRPELHAQLASIQKSRNALELARLGSRPDLTLGFNWISTSNAGISPVANGDDSLLLTVGMNLPVYRNRIDAGIREARSREISATKKYDRLKEEIEEKVTITFSKINSLHQTLTFFKDDIIPKQEVSLKQSIDDYQVGKSDFLQLINNWRQVLQYHLQEKRLETDLRQEISKLHRLLGNSNQNHIDSPVSTP